jgi:Uma2 family endonuclease
MTTTLQAPVTQPARFAVLHGISWSTYESLLQDLGSQRVFLTYDRGDLEIMPPLPIHERWTSILRWLVEAISDELNISLKSYGSTTFRREDLDRGLEPDSCYYVQHAQQMIDKEDLDLSKDPPPDLAIEVDITSRSIAREPIYAALRVPELWRFDRQRLCFLLLNPGGEYDEVERSIAFPFLMATSVSDFLVSLPSADDPTTRRTIRQWVRTAFIDRAS